MSFEDEVLNKINLISTQLQEEDKTRKKNTVEFFEEVKKKILELINEESLKEGKVVYKTMCTIQGGDGKIDLEYLINLGLNDMIFVDWSHCTPQGREFVFRLNLEQFINRENKMTLELK